MAFAAVAFAASKVMEAYLAAADSVQVVVAEASEVVDFDRRAGFGTLED